MTMPLEQVLCLSTPRSLNKRQTLRIHRNVLKEYKKVILFHAFFKYLFLALFILQGVGLLLFYTEPAIFALQLGVLCLSIFTYFILHFYFQAKKPDQFIQLKKRFIEACRKGISIPKGTAEHHLVIAQHLMHFIAHLHRFENNNYELSKHSIFFLSIFQKLSFYLHTEDYFKIKELFYFAAIEEHMQQIRVTPTDLEVHASLANCYVAIAKMYMDAKQFLENKNSRLLRKYEEYLGEKLDFASKRAVEEFHIINEFAPNDLWVHAQLAHCYQVLERFEDEAAEYEKILEIRPHDQEIRFRLAKILFSLGQNAKALKHYDWLKQNKYKKADALLEEYNAAKLSELFDVIF